ncbi:MAG: sialidase family protein [Candidatus Aminicenantes bacterium]|jgi:hypothetical protein
MKKIIAGVFALFLVLGLVVSKNVNLPSTDGLLLSRNVLVSHPGNIRPEEVTICINPTDPLNVVAGSNLDFYYYSTDGGYTWTEGRLESSLGVWGDPSAVFDAEGNLYYGHLSDPVDGDFIDRIVVQKSSDGGRTWSDGAGIGLNPPKDQDKEWLAADHTDSIYRNSIYAAWTEFDRYGSPDPEDRTRILFSYSRDFGENWSDPVVVSDVTGNCIDSDDTVEGAVPAVGPEGQVYLSWAGPLGIVFDKSLDGGQTFGDDIFVDIMPGGWDLYIPGIYRCNGMPATACDISHSPHRGNIYIMWSDQRNGIHDTDVFLVKSTDDGKTWGPIKRVNDDPPGKQQFFPWMTIDQTTGNIYVVFYDRRDSGDFSTEVYLARSSDGGETFRNYKISEYPFRSVSGIFFGDYINIAADDGRIHPIWARMDGIDLSIWTTVIFDNVP